MRIVGGITLFVLMAGFQAGFYKSGAAPPGTDAVPATEPKRADKTWWSLQPPKHLLGLNYEKVTYYHNGVNRRLTDVHGKVITEILA